MSILALGRRVWLQSVLRVACLIAALLVAGGAGAVGGPASWSSEGMEIQWGETPESGPDAWKLLTGGAGAKGVDLVTRDAAGRVVSRHLTLIGLEIDADGWRISETNGELHMAARTADGRLFVRKHISAAGDPWRLNLAIEIENRSGEEEVWGRGRPGLKLGPGLGEYPVDGLGIAETLYSFVEPVITRDGKTSRFPLREPGDVEEIEFQDDGGFGWLGLHSRYHALLLEPREDTRITGVRLGVPDREIDGFPVRYLPSMLVWPQVSELGPGESQRWEFSIFAGPKTSEALTGAGNAGDFHGLLFSSLWQWMRWLSFGLLWLLGAIHALIPSWGLAIILLALLVRVLMYPVAKKALESQKAFAGVQKRIQPELGEIKRQYKGEEQSERILDLYERHGVSPLAGLKPLLIVAIQLPIFVALFYVLGQAYELRDASFFWIQTLAEPDRLFNFGVDLPFFGEYFNLLPVVMAVTTLVTLKAAPAPSPDESGRRRQNLFLGLMGLGFFLLFYPFPSGMVLYWTMANILHLVQQWAVERAR